MCDNCFFKEDMMTLLLRMLLNGNTIDAALAEGVKELRTVAVRTNLRTFRVTDSAGFATTEIYPNSVKNSVTVIGAKDGVIS
jgi:hypothetical protein